MKNDTEEMSRFYSDMRFKQLTLFVSVFTILAIGITQFGDFQLFPALKTKLALSICGFIITAIIWIMENRATLYWIKLSKDNVIFNKDPSLKNFRPLSATYGVGFLYCCAMLFWIVYGYKWNVHLIITIIEIVIFIYISIFTIFTFRKKN